MLVRNWEIPWEKFKGTNFQLAMLKNLDRIPDLSSEVFGYLTLNDEDSIYKDIDQPLVDGLLENIDQSLFHYFFLEHTCKGTVVPISVILIEGMCYMYGLTCEKKFIKESTDRIDLIAPVSEIEIKKSFAFFGLKIKHNSISLFEKDFIDVWPTFETPSELKLKIGIKHKEMKNNVIELFSTIKSKISENPELSMSYVERLRRSQFYPRDIEYEFSSSDLENLKATINEKIKNREIYVSAYTDLLWLNEFQETSLSILNQILSEQGINEFSLVEITRSTNPKLPIGPYIYEISNEGRIILLRPPLKIIIDENGNAYSLFDKEAYEDSLENILVIQSNEIKDFQLFGTEMMINKVETIEPELLKDTIDSPKLLGTAFRELFFGSAYANLVGMSSMMQQLNQNLMSNKVSIHTISEIKDTRIVQVVFTDKTDVEFSGISIYYDFNRKMGNIKNKETQSLDSKKELNINLNEKEDGLSKLKEYKLMLEEGLIDEDEFKDLKKKILGL